MRNKLTARQVQTVKKVGRYADGGGLYLLICRPGYKQWTFASCWQAERGRWR